MIMNHQPTGVDRSHCSLEAELLQHQMNTLGLRTLATHSQPHLQPIPGPVTILVLGLVAARVPKHPLEKIQAVIHGEIS